MQNTTLLDAVHAYEAGDSDMSHREILAYVEKEIQQNYAHLSPLFYPDNCFQAKIRVPSGSKVVLLNNPKPYIEILEDSGFTPHRFEHVNESCDHNKDGTQYTLINREIEKIGYRFVLKATLGTNFISVWFRNESQDWRLDLPVFYALEIINRLQDRVNQADVTRYYLESCRAKNSLKVG